MYALRILGGTLFMTGALIAIYNLYRTAAAGAFQANETAHAPPLAPVAPVQTSKWHRVLETRPVQFSLLTLLAVLVGGVVEYVPTAIVKSNVPTIASVKPYSPLEVEGRD